MFSMFLRGGSTRFPTEVVPGTCDLSEEPLDSTCSVCVRLEDAADVDSTFFFVGVSGTVRLDSATERLQGQLTDALFEHYQRPAGEKQLVRVDDCATQIDSLAFDEEIVPVI
jgi:hypothetical protein